ncbi:carboxypeptidase Y-deficient [Marasmius tenuissimus]|uniref:Carboxypeptidase Y-deficient n=1 Tax=Marasmius tenuissimus TaxID=585030 RepID=A0ABR3ADH3_9AGAR
MSLQGSRPVSFVSEKPVVLVPSSPPASPPPKSLSMAIDVSKPAQEDNISNGSPAERSPELTLEPESDPPTPEPEQVQKPKLDTQPQPELQTAVASSSTASTSLAPPSPTTEARPPPASRKSTTFRRVVPRKAQPQTPTPQRPALAVRQNAPASPSPLSQTTSPAIHDDRPLPPASTGSESQLLDLIMPKPVQTVSPPPRSSSLTASTSSNTTTAVVSTPSPGIAIPAPTFTSQPSSPTRASPGPSTPTPTPVKQKSAPKRAPYRPGFQPNGFYRPRTDEFLALRRVARDGAESGVGRKRMERTKLERRLEKLIGLHFPEGKDAAARPVMKERRSSIFDVSLSDLRSASGSSIWKGVVGGGAKNDIRGELRYSYDLRTALSDTVARSLGTTHYAVARRFGSDEMSYLQVSTIRLSISLAESSY